MATARLRPQVMRLTDAAANRIKSVTANAGRPQKPNGPIPAGDLGRTRSPFPSNGDCWEQGIAKSLAVDAPYR